MPQLDVDHIIAVHDLRRPVARAVSSVLDGNCCALRVTVVCHNVSSHDVRAALGAHAEDNRLRLLELGDGVPSPSGPFNLGFDQATARFTSIMGSDDELEPGAIDSWVTFAEASQSEVVIPRVQVVGRGPMMTPPVRLGRTRHLDGVRDRLAYRSSPLGLVSRERFGGLRFPAGLRSGIDVEYGMRLWFSGARIGFDRRGPAYVVHDDAPVRVSTVRKPVSGDASFLDGLLTSESFARLGVRQRTAFVTKMLRGNLLQWISARSIVDLWTDDDVRVMGETVRRCAEVSPEAFRPLSKTDRDILDAFSRDPVDLGHALTLLPGRTAIRPRNVVPRHPLDFFAREAPLRFGIASRVLARRS
jgi:hypothetical protein